MSLEARRRFYPKFDHYDVRELIDNYYMWNTNRSFDIKLVDELL